MASLLDRHTGTALCERFWILPREQLLALYSKRKGVSLGRQLQVVLLARFPGTVRLSHHLVPIEIFEKGHFAWPIETSSIRAHGSLHPDLQQMDRAGQRAQHTGQGVIFPQVMARVHLPKVRAGEAEPGVLQIGMTFHPAKLGDLLVKAGPPVHREPREREAIIRCAVHKPIVQIRGKVSLGKAAGGARKEHAHLLNPPLLRRQE